MLYDILIIGAGPAGMTAGIYAKRANLKVAMIEKYVPGGQIVDTAEIENYTGYEKMSGYELATKMLNHTRSLDVELLYEDVIDIIDEGSIKKVITASKTLETKVVIIASGAIPRRLGVENEDQLANRGISWCAICDGPIYRDKDLLVVGGGNSGVEEAAYLATLANSVVVIQNLPHLTADKKAQEILFSKENVTYKYSAVVEKFLVNDEGGMKGALIKYADGKTEEIYADGVFEYVGLVPVTNMAQSLNITSEAGYVLVNEKMETKVPGIFSAGDVNNKQIRQVVTATADGAIAVQNALKYLETWK